MTPIRLAVQDAERVTLKASAPPPVRLSFGQSGGGDARDYNALTNKPSIEGHALVGDSTLPQIGVADITPQDIDQIIYG